GGALMRWSGRTLRLTLVMALALGSTLAFAGAPQAAAPHALLVGTFNGIAGRYRTIQAAVAAARPGDTVLVAPGVYHEVGTAKDGVLITTQGIRVRGMDRNHVIVAGTAPSAAQPCSNDVAAQNPGLGGRNGIEVKADGVYVENLTVCNFLSGAGGGGNQVWW